MKRRVILLSVFIFLFKCPNFFVTSLFAQTEFSNLDLNNNNELLFTMSQNFSGRPSYSTLFLTELENKNVKESLKMLTCFPEQIQFFSFNNQLEIHNRFGKARYSFENKKLKWISYTELSPTSFYKCPLYLSSPDGKYSLYVSSKNFSRGKLILVNNSTLEETVIASDVDFSYKEVPAKWAFDSKVFVYESNGELYFYSPESIAKKIKFSEHLRKIGTGKISCVNWTSKNTLLYLDKDIVFEILENELYTRTLYSSVLGKGKILGHLDEDFNPSSDVFYCDDNALSFFVLSRSNTLTHYLLEENNKNYLQTKAVYSLSALLKNEGNPLSFKIFWNKENIPCLWIEYIKLSDGKKSAALYLINEGLQKKCAFDSATFMLLSPDKKNLALGQENSLILFSLEDFEIKNVLTNDKYQNSLWKDEQTLICATSKNISLWNIKDNVQNVLVLSSASSSFWKDDKICCNQDKNFFEYDKYTCTWKQLNIDFAIPESCENNGSYRVFTADCKNKKYKNAIYVRSLSSSALTYCIFNDCEKNNQKVKKCALIIDAIDNDSGVAKILEVLNQYKIDATFFLNGEFIRRYPEVTKQIVKSGFDCASMFYSPIDLTLKDFLVDEDFIKKGLARNEDEFFYVSGKELLPLWHAPYHYSNDYIRNAGKKSGYNYVQAFTAYRDSVTAEKNIEDPSYLYLSACQLVELYTASLENKIVLPVTAGKVCGTRKDYLYEKLDLLICSIQNQGYEIVSLTSLID